MKNNDDDAEDAKEVSYQAIRNQTKQLGKHFLLIAS